MDTIAFTYRLGAQDKSQEIAPCLANATIRVSEKEVRYFATLKQILFLQLVEVGIPLRFERSVPTHG